MIASMAWSLAEYLNVVAQGYDHELSTRTYQLPDERGSVEKFPFTGPNFRIMVELKFRAS
jgi:hypothetical protein